MSSSPSLRRQQAPTGVNAVLSARFALALFLGSIFAFGAPQLRAQSDSSTQDSQDVAEAARQERARKQQPADEHHVYTNEDLRRGKILTQEDQSRAAASKQKPQPAPTTKPDAQPLDANSGTRQEPLGDVARRYRNLKRESVHPSPFHLPANQPELAAPKMLAPLPALKANSQPQPQPPARNFVLVNPSAPVHRTPNVDAPVMPSAPLRRVDPFSRRLQPVPPSVAIQPNRPRASVQPNLAAPTLRVEAPSNRAVYLRPSPVLASPLNTIVVRPGDTLWTLSRQHLGRGTRWLELMAANPNLPDPIRLAPGTSLVLPSRSLTHHAKPASSSVTVQSGDTLSEIAFATYGHASAWTCVAQANPSLLNPHLLTIGQSVVLPASCAR
jgi:nucleoid-associated protein YgaU